MIDRPGPYPADRRQTDPDDAQRVEQRRQRRRTRRGARGQGRGRAVQPDPEPREPGIPESALAALRAAYERRRQ